MAGIVQLGTLLPFRVVPEVLAHFTGVQVSAETVRRLTEAAGAVQVGLQTAAVDAIERHLPTPGVGPAVQLLSVDGCMVSLVGGVWREVRTLVVGTVEGAGQTRDLSYFSHLSDAATFNRLATVETQRRGTETAGTVVAVVDGAVWCQGFIDQQRQDAVRILDFWHVLEHLGGVAQARFGAGTAAASEWLSQQSSALRQGDELQVLARVWQMAESASGEVGEVARSTAQYLSARREQVRYQTFLGAGYPIGSGCVESANKSVVAGRLKGSGMHWGEEQVNAMLALRTVWANGRWEEVWPAVWSAWRQDVSQRQRASRRQCQRASVVEPAIPAADLAPTPPPQPAPPQRPQTIINGKPTADHPWRKTSLFRAKQ